MYQLWKGSKLGGGISCTSCERNKEEEYRVPAVKWKQTRRRNIMYQLWKGKEQGGGVSCASCERKRTRSPMYQLWMETELGKVGGGACSRCTCSRERKLGGGRGRWSSIRWAKGGRELVRVGGSCTTTSQEGGRELGRGEGRYRDKDPNPIDLTSGQSLHYAVTIPAVPPSPSVCTARPLQSHCPESAVMPSLLCSWHCK